MHVIEPKTNLCPSNQYINIAVEGSSTSQHHNELCHRKCNSGKETSLEQGMEHSLPARDFRQSRYFSLSVSVLAVIYRKSLLSLILDKNKSE